MTKSKPKLDLESGRTRRISVRVPWKLYERMLSLCNKDTKLSDVLVNILEKSFGEQDD